MQFSFWTDFFVSSPDYHLSIYLTIKNPACIKKACSYLINITEDINNILG
jgi:hypothetical protein